MIILRPVVFQVYAQFNSILAIFQVWGKTKKDYTYTHRSGALGDMPATGTYGFLYCIN